jgi:hypothetical protein
MDGVMEHPYLSERGQVGELKGDLRILSRIHLCCTTG